MLRCLSFVKRRSYLVPEKSRWLIPNEIRFTNLLSQAFAAVWGGQILVRA